MFCSFHHAGDSVLPSTYVDKLVSQYFSPSQFDQNAARIFFGQQNAKYTSTSKTFQVAATLPFKLRNGFNTSRSPTSLAFVRNSNMACKETKVRTTSGQSEQEVQNNVKFHRRGGWKIFKAAYKADDLRWHELQSRN